MAQIRDTNREAMPGTYPPEWLPDHDANSCISCDSLFTLIRRRHHCRSCGKIFCSDCCRQRAKLLYLGNKEGRVCNNCYYILETAALTTEPETITDREPSVTTTNEESNTASTSSNIRVQGVLKTNDQANSSANRDNETTSSSGNQLVNKQVMFSDGIRPGTDLSESYGFSNIPSTSDDNNSVVSNISVLTRQNKNINAQSSSSSKKSRNSKSFSHVTFCDDLGYLPPLMVSKSSLKLNGNEITLSELKLNQAFGDVETAKTSNHPSSENSPANNIMIFDELCKSVDVDSTLTFVLLKDFYLKVKVVLKVLSEQQKNLIKTDDPNASDCAIEGQEFWCFASDGLSRLGQSEIVLVLNRDVGDSTIPRDVFKIYLTIHELALRRQSLENLGNLLFQDGLFGERDTAGLLLVRHVACQDVKDYILPDKRFLFALVLQRWEVPWSKVFPVRLLLRLGHKSGHYPYPLVSYRSRAPVYYEVGHTIISILGDFRNFRYSITHVEGLKVIIIKSERKIIVQLNQSCYQQFNKVLDSSSNEHVLAWSSYPFDDADGHLVAVQNDDGNYETVEFYKQKSNEMISFENLDLGDMIGASFVIFSGALKANQSNRAAKISIVEDGLLIQLQSCTMSALKQAIHCMHEFDIDCENSQDILNKVNICWLPKDEQ